ncbi:MAG: MarR family transcriptional regulator [Desulfobacterales bacterium]|nr:MarR family transcriptional regulator [Desulfobacterales bacterium]
MFTTFKKGALGRRINILFRLCVGHLRREMKKLGVGMGDYAFLLSTFAQPGQSQDELSRDICVDKSYTARALSRLEKLDLIRREPDPDQYRVKRVYPTDLAMAIQGDIFDIVKTHQAILTRGMEPERVERIREDLDLMIENMIAHVYHGAGEEK